MADVDKTKLAEYIEKLLREGKRSNHEDFQVLFRILPKCKNEIIQIAKDIIDRGKKANDTDSIS